ncbi:MAG: flagellar biosynthesis protein FlhB [Leptolyngbya sp. PLA1]|nr:flagellar biosynthesis protein FlhB [Leptolyngbya sp. PLA1]
MAEDMGDKTEAPSSRKLEEARSRGQVAKSQDLAGAIELVGALVVFVVFGALMSRSLLAILRRVFEDGYGVSGVQGLGTLLTAVAVDAAWAVLPALGLLAGVCILAHFVQVGPLLTGHPLIPKLSKINPVAGAQRLFDRRNAVKTLTQIVKIALVAAVGWVFLASRADVVTALPRLGLWGALSELGGMALELALWLLAILLVLGIADWAFQKWQHTQDLKMTKEEVKDERRSMEGDPEVKGRRLRLARQIAMQRVGMAVPEADVVVTNPTHFSVAIKYDPETMKAPKVVAKGADFLALRIRQVAAANRVPMVERPPLARALFAGVEVGEEISPEFYQAVAEILAFVYRLDREAAA